MAQSPKTILITGASSGLGAALALCYAAPGVTLCLQGRHAERLSHIAETCKNKGATVHTGQLDITDPDHFFRWAQGLDRRFGVDLLIVNAGISAGSAGLDGIEPIAQARQIFNTNLMGALTTLEPVLPGMISRGTGQIALIASMASFLALPGAPAYAASKAALRYYGEALSGQLGPKGIHVSVICPGFIKTPMTDVNNYPMPFLMPAEKAASLIKTQLQQKKDLIVFPKAIRFFTLLVSALPIGLRKLLLNCAPRKKSL